MRRGEPTFETNEKPKSTSLATSTVVCYLLANHSQSAVVTSGQSFILRLTKSMHLYFILYAWWLCLLPCGSLGQVEVSVSAVCNKAVGYFIFRWAFCLLWIFVYGIVLITCVENVRSIPSCWFFCLPKPLYWFKEKFLACEFLKYAFVCFYCVWHSEKVVVRCLNVGLSLLQEVTPL